MNIKNLSKIPFENIIKCFNESFASYFVELPKDSDFWKQRWGQANVDYSLSFGMFDNDKLVGFILNAIDFRNDELVAYNSGTGVLPNYRGRKIIKSVYDYALPILKQNNIERCTLEVVQENEIAIRLYKSIGFNIIKKYKCFQGEINLHKNNNIILVELDINNIDGSNLLNQDIYSWDFHLNVLKRGNYKYYKVFNNDILESYFIVNPENGYIAQFEVFKNDKDSLRNLFIGISTIVKTIKINNIDEKSSDKIYFINKLGFKNTVDQYEMELKI